MPAFSHKDSRFSLEGVIFLIRKMSLSYAYTPGSLHCKHPDAYSVKTRVYTR